MCNKGQQQALTHFIFHLFHLHINSWANWSLKKHQSKSSHLYSCINQRQLSGKCRVSLGWRTTKRAVISVKTEEKFSAFAADNPLFLSQMGKC